ncbi:hypothetical protein HYDPIDRAFT_112055 [Hydnomerulius pinastri MD-312]|uniref:DUF6534 domain-containing protein n=1 Tax=Hydnomerulius pinastri MD-312 TaxID=994086 RepID=A0A0C9WG19_9AGAM|nr:hypothetical protein HYDPIDRAFT_112055 [Hydnomerulius pinastri MD-312]
MATLIPSPPAFDNTLGALLIGFGASAVAYGMFTIQVYTYYRRYPSDKAGYKALVALLWILETADQALIGHCVYYYSITNYMNIAALFGKPVWSIILQMTIGALVGTVVKLCFSMRVWRFSYRNWWLTGILMLLTFGQMGLAITFTIKSFELPGFPDLVNLRVVGSISLGLGVINDMAVAAALCYYLQSMRSSYSNADSMIRTLTIYAVNTGVLTSACSFATLIIFDFMPNNFIFICCYFVLSKLYAISFLATLNTRKIIRGRGTDREHGKTTSFQMVTDSMQRTINIPMQMPMPTIQEDLDYIEEYQKSQTRSQDSTHSSAPHYAIGW